MRKILLVLVLLLVLATLLPGYVPHIASAQEEATPEPPMEEETPGLEFDFPGAEALAGLDSYRFRIIANAEGEGVVEEGQTNAFTIEGEYTREPEATRIIYSLPEGSSGEETPCGQSRCEYITVGSQSWTYNAESDTWTSELTGAMLVGFLRPSFFLSIFLAGWPENAPLVNGHEDLSGVDTSHYRWEPSLEEALATLGEEALEGIEGKVEELSFDLWQANKLGYPAKFSLILAGTDEEGKSGRVEIGIEVFDANAPIVIKAPEGAKAAPQMDIPTPDDAQVLLSTADIIMYTTAKSVEDTATFYKAQMPVQGWEEDKEGSFSTEDMVSLAFKKGNQTASIFISADESGKTQVMASISTEEGEEE